MTTAPLSSTQIVGKTFQNSVNTKKLKVAFYGGASGHSSFCYHLSFSVLFFHISLGTTLGTRCTPSLFTPPPTHPCNRTETTNLPMKVVCRYPLLFFLLKQNIYIYVKSPHTSGIKHFYIHTYQCIHKQYV
ncbi:hypothetical protein, unlikely [Trypanosoma brucei gambiense DAL972]|uniref:Uncharacterized protein n=1 Tax=Trypanosoma brucei gambiense (strain MHOM/CI/86/DAL972) TaxID=679716 RepID=C9ZYY2_TRYB9|nr:hypothetical protein, unlikely [Trypanosoma brucei gambiense DAL972]CBH14631.1 hypothetical protein, unlikely [Trypanosoma brucei gambiense DAL972]|eukprot:XP_011776897.1 hypothetical protein, unlikely [Trypanosoma brucei gambiense DAL972]